MTTPEKLSTLWVVIMFNMAFADIVGFVAPGAIADLMAASTDGVTIGTSTGVVITPMFLVIAGLFIEVAIAMIYLSKALPRPSNRIANFIAPVLTAVFVIGGGSMAPHYIFFASIEIAALIAIVVIAWGWTDDV